MVAINMRPNPLSPLLRGWRAGVKFTGFAVLSLLLISCEAISYYTQAARGQLKILTNRQDIKTLLARQDLPQDLRDKFERMLQIRRFALSELELPVDDNYLTYVDIGREHVVWNVFAAPEFSTQAVSWCYPVAGCLSYRGYFSKSVALAYAEELESQGLDVYIGGVDAYSTLGWFDDSLLSTVMDRSDYQLAGLVFHELAHQVAFAAGDTSFNESFATAVEREGIRRWSESLNDKHLLEGAELSLSRQSDFAALMRVWRSRFQELYGSELPDVEKRSRKRALQSELRGAYQLLKKSWQGYGGYDAWFAKELNNAQLSTVASYNDWIPAFEVLLDQEEGKLSSFYRRVAQLADQEAPVREETLRRLNSLAFEAAL